MILPDHPPEGAGTRSGDGAPRDPELVRAEAEIERTRERVAGSMMALRQEVARRTDWRRWVRTRPLVFFAGAMTLGFLLGFRGRALKVNRR